MLTVRLLTFFILAIATLALAQSQQTRDALQERDIRMLENRTDAMAIDIARLSSDLTTLTLKMGELRGIGIGFGAALTVLSAVQVILQVRNARKT